MKDSPSKCKDCGRQIGTQASPAWEVGGARYCSDCVGPAREQHESMEAQMRAAVAVGFQYWTAKIMFITLLIILAVQFMNCTKEPII